MPLYLLGTFSKIQNLCFREHPACKPLYKYGWEPLTDDAPGSFHADYARYSRRLCRIRTASSAFFMKWKRGRAYYSPGMPAVVVRGITTQNQTAPEKRQKSAHPDSPLLYYQFPKMKSTKSTVYNSFTYGRLQFGVPLCHEALVPLLPDCTLDPFSFFQNSILSQMKTYSRTFFSEIWLLHRSYSTKISHNPVFSLPVERKCALPLKYIAKIKTPLKLKIKAFWNVSACPLLLLSLLPYSS